MKNKLPVYKPYIPESSVNYAIDAIQSTWISSIGKYIDLATKKLSEVLDCRYVLLVNNGTSATHLVARSLKKFKPQVKRVLVPSACYVAAYNSLLYDNNDWKVECVDLDMNTWNMKVERELKHGDAIFAVHNLGNIINVPKLKNTYNIPIIEDNCEGFFGMYNNSHSGTESLCSSLSFFGNKNVTCGEGGAFITNNKEVYEYALKLRGQGQTKKRYVHDELGYNYRMTNIQAAILLGQLENLDYIFSNKQRVFNRYNLRLKNSEHIKMQRLEENTSHSMWMFGVRFCNLKSYNHAKKYFDKFGIETRPMFYPHTVHSHLNFIGDSKNATKLNKQIVVFPSFPELKNEEIDYICDKINKYGKS
jgi:perosamine synthetase